MRLLLSVMGITSMLYYWAEAIARGASPFTVSSLPEKITHFFEAIIVTPLVCC